jgi:hypothetical protein
VEYQLEGDKVFSSSLSKKIRYNRPLLVKEAKSRPLTELDHMVNQEVEGVIEDHFLPRGYVFEQGSKG